MESYIGFNLQFFTEKEKVSGILNDFNIEKEIVEIDCNGTKKEIPISEILKINIIPNDSSDEDLVKECSEQGKDIQKSDLKEESKESFKINTSKDTEYKEELKTNFIDDLKEKKISSTGDTNEDVMFNSKTSGKSIIKDKILPDQGSNKTVNNNTNSMSQEKNSLSFNGALMDQSVEDPKTLFKSLKKSMGIENTKHAPVSSSDQKNGSIEKDISKPGNTIKRALYKNLLNEAFIRYGPTVEEFICYGSLQIIKTLKSIIKNVEAKIDIVLGDIPIFNRLGYVVARSLMLTYKNVCVVEPNFIDVNAYKYKLTYIQSSGKVCKDIREGAEILLSFCRACDLNIEVTTNLKKVIFVYEPSNNFSKEIDLIFIGFGAIIEEYLNFKGDYYVLDIMISDILYKKYNIRKGFSGSIMKLTTNRK